MGTAKFIFTAIVFAAILAAQAPQPNAAETPPALPNDIRLGAGDVIQIHAVDAPEISDKPLKIGSDGYVNLVSVGRIKVAGLTVEELQAELIGRLKRLILEPDVAVSVVETFSQPVSVLGAVRNPGVIQLQGQKTLMQVLSLAGGPLENAGYTARITRRKEFAPLPLPNATEDSTGQYLVAEVNLQKIMDTRDPAANILIKPNDVISVPKAEMVYVIGDVLKAGAIALGDQKTVTVLQAISIASGVGKTAKATEARILRVSAGSATRTEVMVNLKAMLSGKASDIPMQPDDILFVPSSLRKELGMKTLEAAAGSGLTSIIYRLP